MIRKLIIIFLLLCTPVYAGSISMPQYGTNDTLTAVNQNQRFNLLTNEMNGALDNTNASVTNGFRFIEKEPKQEHLLQMQLFMMFEKIDNGILLYVGRDNGFMIEHVYHKDDLPQFDMGVQFFKLKKLKNMIEYDQLPDKDFKICLKNINGVISEEFQKDSVKYKSDWQCRTKDGKSYCQWKDLCWKEELKEIFKHKFYIDGQFID